MKCTKKEKSTIGMALYFAESAADIESREILNAAEIEQEASNV